MRIAILGTRGIPARYGGFETFAERLAVGLVQRGHQVTVYAEPEGAPGADQWHEGVRVRPRRRPAWGPASTLAYDSACLWDARRGYDLVYMLGYGAAWACWWPRARCKASSPGRCTRSPRPCCCRSIRRPNAGKPSPSWRW